MPSTPTPAPDLDIMFHDYLQPVATAGVYTVKAKLILTKDGDPIVTDDAPLPTVEDRYEIRAAQFFLDPTTVHALYPPDGATGLYSTVLPHITLNRASLPWERELPGRAIPAREPWLALLVFAAGEVDDDPAALGRFTQRTVGELRWPEPDTIIGPELSGEIDDDLECRTIDVPADVFTAIVPRKAEMLYLAHVRDVNIATRRGGDGEILTEGKYAVLAANRFPRGAGDYAVHLVSLEGHLDRLTSLSEGTERVRLCTLWSWSFTNDPTGRVNPAVLLRDMVAPGIGAGAREELALRLRPDTAAAATPEEEYAHRQLHHGYAPVPYRVLSGEQTFAWYRGPFTPLTAPEVPDPIVPGPHATADHALIYDKAHGLFDVSYAAAWTLGRTLALADPDYTGEATAMRRELSNRLATLGALDTDSTRALNDPDAPAGAAALRNLAAIDMAGLIQSLHAPLVRQAPPPLSVRTARRDTRALLRDPRVHQSLSAVADARTPTMSEWLERLSLLRGVPFHHLVADPRMLPPESLRAFRIDPHWIKALVAGAADVGAHTSVDRDLDPLLHERLGRLSTDTPAAGLLINSELVRAWPVFDILASLDDEPVGELRRDHLAPDVLLVLWDEVPDQIAIREPGQGIHLGLTDEGRITLRHLTGDEIGSTTDELFPDPAIPGDGTVFTRFLRPGRRGAANNGDGDVLNLLGTNGLIPALSRAVAPDDPDPADLTPGQFALELVNAPLEQLLLPANTSLRSRP